MALSWKRSLIYGVILIIAVVTYWVYSETSGPRFDQGLQKREADMKKTLPRKVDDITTLEDVKYEGTKNVYWLSIDAGGSIDASDLQHRTQSLLCSTVISRVRSRKRGSVTNITTSTRSGSR
jgi:hypothetical protein